MMYRVASTALNLRDAPELAGHVVRELPHHTAVVTPLPQGRAPGWLAVRTFDGYAGWVASRYLAPDSAPWLTVAREEETRGVVELPGGKHSARILEYHGATTLHATSDEVAWCSSFVNWCFLTTGLMGTRLANARSWLRWGRVLTEPIPGCVVVLSRGLDPASGHVGFYERQLGDRIWLTGGNQGNEVCEAPFAKSRVLGYRWPTAAPVPALEKPAA